VLLRAQKITNHDIIFLKLHIHEKIYQCVFDFVYWHYHRFLMIFGTMTIPHRVGDLATFDGLRFAANIIAAGMITSSGIISLALLKIFDKN